MRHLVLLPLLLLLIDRSQAADEAAIVEFGLASRLDLPNFAQPTRFAGCAQKVADHAPEIRDHVQRIHRARIESDMMSDPNLKARPFANLAGEITSDYLKPMSQALNGYRLATSHIPEHVRNFSSFTHYIGKDLWGSPVALLRIGSVTTKDLGVAPSVPGTTMIYPQWQSHDYWILDDIFIGLDFRTKDCLNETVLFNGFIQGVLKGNRHQANIERIIAFSDNERRSKMLKTLGFVPRAWPSSGAIHLERGETLQKFDFAQQASLGWKIFEYEIVR